MALWLFFSFSGKEALRAHTIVPRVRDKSTKAIILWDFEADSGNFEAPPYYISNPSWQWGSPTAGPSGAHSGVNCWGTNLSGDYEPNTDWRLESPSYDLSSYSAVALEFWHWYYTESGYDTCRLEVSTDGGATWTAVAKWAGSSGGWVFEHVDLGAYAGASDFRFRFRLTSDGSVQYEGWYVDDVQLLGSNSTTIIHATSFEGADDGGFSVGGSSPAPWERGVPSSGPGSAWDGTRVWATGLAGDYNNDADEWIVSSTWNLSAYSTPTLRFWYWYDTETSYDTCFLELSTDGGLTWSRLDAFAGHDATWRSASYSLPASQVQIRFRFSSDGSVTYPGFYLDSLTVYDASWVSLGSWDFEADSGPFTPDPPSGLVNANEWEWGSPTAGPSGAHSGSRCWGTDLDGNYENNLDIELRSPSVDVSGWPRVTLQVWMWRDGESADTSFVEVSPDGGTTWHTVDAITSDISDWTLKQYDVTSYASTNFRVRFRLKTDGSVNYPGWYVDDVALDTVAVPLGGDPICVSQGYIAFYINNSDEPGTFTSATDTLHIWGADLSILYGGGSHSPWSSYLTVHCLNNNTDYITRTADLTPATGFSLDTLAKYYLGTWRVKDSEDSVVSIWEVEYSPGDTMRIEQFAFAEGNTQTDARIRLWTLIINKSGSSNLRVGVRYVWDIHIDTTDAPFLQPFFGPDGWGSLYSWENNWWTSGARYTPDSMAYYYKEVEVANLGSPNNHWHYLSARWSPWNPQPTVPDTVYYVRWPLVASSYGGGYAWEVPYDSYDSRDSVGNNWDDSYVALWVPRVVQPGDTLEINQYVWSSVQPLYWDVDESGPTAPFRLLSPTLLRPGSELVFATSGLERLNLKLYRIDGRLAAVLWNGPASAGVHRVALPKLSSGVYVLKVEERVRRSIKLVVE